MSELRDILYSGMSFRMIASGDTCQNLSTGTFFQAEMQEVSEIEQEAMVAVGEIREAMRMHVVDDAASNALREQQFVKIFYDGVWQTYRIVSRRNNPASIATTFGLIYKTDGDT